MAITTSRRLQRLPAVLLPMLLLSPIEASLADTCPPISQWHHDLYGAYSAGAWVSRVPIASYHPLRGRFLGADWNGDSTWGGGVICRYRLFFMNTSIEMHSLVTYEEPQADQKNWQQVNEYNYHCKGSLTVKNCPITPVPAADQMAKPCVEGPVVINPKNIPVPFRNPNLVCKGDSSQQIAGANNITPDDTPYNGSILANLWYFRSLGV